MTKTKSNVIVYLGDPFENSHEERFLNRLRRDLQARGVAATILANFVTPRPNQRQIDFLVLTDFRLAHVELKTLDQRAPLIGGGNGPWCQDHPDGGRHTIDPNPYRQAQLGTFAISDTVRQLAKTTELPGGGRDFYKHVDTVVCIDPDIPHGSTLEAYTHVTAAGYAQLLDRLTTPGPRPPWDSDQWGQLILGLRLYPEQDRSPTEIRRRAATEAVAEYTRRFTKLFAAGLHELVPVGFDTGTAAPGSSDTASDLLTAIEKGQRLVLEGQSGTGKTHLARHLALELSRRGTPVMWLRADEYDKGHFGHLLGRSVAPYATVTATELAAHAYTAGAALVVVVDGFNECRPALRSEMVEQLNAFALRHPATLLITTTVPVTLTEPLEARTVRLRPPDSTERTAVLASYGAKNPDLVSPAFTTAFELSVAAACESQLGPSATQADLFDAYVRQLCPSETHRAGLRNLADRLTGQLRTSVPLSDAITVLESRSGAGLAPQQVDEILANRLLLVTQGHVGFTHELLGRFLTAEHLVLAANGAEHLAEALSEAHHKDLRQLALSLEHDPDQQAEVLRLLADADLYLAAVEGKLGESAADNARATIRGTLADAAFLTTPESAQFTVAAEFFGRWDMTTSWSPAEFAQLQAAGPAAGHGWFIPEVCALLDRTDVLVEAAVSELIAAGARNPLSTPVCGAYTQQGNTTMGGLAGTIVMAALDGSHPWSRSRTDHSLTAILLDGAGPRPWGRLYLACLVANSYYPEDRACLPDLLRRAWKAGGYHLRLGALEMVNRNARNLDPAEQDRLADAVEELETDHIFLQSGIVEALAACGRATSTITASDILEQIDAVLREPDNPDACGIAAGMVGAMFEDEELVGPYYDTIETLEPPKRTRLLMMAAHHEGWMFRGWALRQVLDAIATDDVALLGEQLKLFRLAAEPVTMTTSYPQDETAVHMAGVRGVARITGQDPSAGVSDDPVASTWSLVDQLVASLEGAAVDVEAVWSELLGASAGPAVDVFSEISGAELGEREDTRTQLEGRFPAQLRQLLEWALQHRDRLPSPHRFSDLERRDRYIVATLGRVGDEKTARLLGAYRSEPGLADTVVKAIRNIHAR